MAKLTKWQKKLTAAQRRHVKENSQNTLASVRRNVEFQAKMRFPCWDCIEIGRRLGMEVETTAFNEADD